MLHESAHVRITVEWGIATLWLGFPGEPVNGLDAARLRELDVALEALKRLRRVRVMVIRSAKPAGFCAGIHPQALVSLETAADRAAFSWLGQTMLAKLAALPQTTVALIEGPCLDAGFELALACDHRLSVATMRTHLGFPGRAACFGGSPRLRQRIGRRKAQQLLSSGRTLSGREAQAIGIVDRAFCERRAKIELRTFLDELEQRPRIPRRVELNGFAEERRMFADAPVSLSSTGRGEAEKLAAQALRGLDVIVPDVAPVLHALAVALARGFITPLEAEKGRTHIREFPRLSEPHVAAQPASELVAA